MKATPLLEKDHAAVKQLFRACEKADKADDNAKPAIADQIAAEFEVPACEEENEMFPEAQKTLGDRTLEDLADRIEKLKAELGAAPPAAKGASR